MTFLLRSWFWKFWLSDFQRFSAIFSDFGELRWKMITGTWFFRTESENHHSQWQDHWVTRGRVPNVHLTEFRETPVFFCQLASNITIFMKSWFSDFRDFQRFSAIFSDFGCSEETFWWNRVLGSLVWVWKPPLQAAWCKLWVCPRSGIIFLKN